MDKDSSVNGKEAHIQHYLYQQCQLAYSTLKETTTSFDWIHDEHLGKRNDQEDGEMEFKKLTHLSSKPQHASSSSSSSLSSRHHTKRMDVENPIRPSSLTFMNEEQLVELQPPDDVPEDIDVHSSVSNYLPGRRSSSSSSSETKQIPLLSRHPPTTSLFTTSFLKPVNLKKGTEPKPPFLKKKKMGSRRSMPPSSSSPDLLAYLRQMALKRRQASKSTRKFFKAPQGNPENLNKGILLGNSKALQNFLAETQRSSLKRVTLSKTGIQTKAIQGVPDLTFPAHPPNLKCMQPPSTSSSTSTASTSSTMPTSTTTTSRTHEDASILSKPPLPRRSSKQVQTFHPKKPMFSYPTNEDEENDDQTINEIEALLQDSSETESLLKELEIYVQDSPPYLPY
ncbi:hypothetical protein HMI54_012084 [Coelomomyces lativittatus]|nr:hypothetical protein HMI55_004926 [Coelomomyces lativittatus]KAJ1515572.1 hypothetical protein HMI54_012084 [Coelomomyces lativittatus]KAJ1515835.1 hypothetical protein HMI56_000309 [Coelomomyces lativittatus]